MSYLSDIFQQPQVLRSLVQTYQAAPPWEQLDRILAERQYPKLVLTGMGGSYYALYPTWLALNQAGVPTIQIQAAELVHYAPALLKDDPLLIVVSQSGESVEIQRLLEEIPGQLRLISVTNGLENRLSRHSTLALATQAGAEVGVATKTYTSSLALLYLLGRALTQQLHPQDYDQLLQIADRTEALLDQWQDWLAPAWSHLQAAEFFALLGRGPAVASARDGALILQEAARLPAWGLSGGQFRHGPMEAISPGMGVILFANRDQTWELNQRLAIAIASHGGRVVCVGEAVADPRVVNLPIPAIGAGLQPLVEILAVQLLAAEFAAQAGIVPGEFRWSGKVIQIE